MPGTIVFKPIGARLKHNTDIITKMNPYCVFMVGHNRVRGKVCKRGGKHPKWLETITMPVHNETKALIYLMDKDKITRDDHIGSCVIDLSEVECRGQISKWHSLYYKDKFAGELLLEADFLPDAPCTCCTCQTTTVTKTETICDETGRIKTITQEQYETTEPVCDITCTHTYQEGQIDTAHSEFDDLHNVAVTEGTTMGTIGTVGTVDTVDTVSGGHVFTEQRQFVEPRTFVKEVEVVETRPVLQEIEVMEPVRVIKDVQVTETVPVRKQIEVMEPEIVIKEVETIEPRLVTKTIQVVEDMPVIKEVEVIELRNTTQQVQTVEPQTFTKQVEVTEYVPTRKQVEVTEPVTIKKAVEFIEPIITTQTITKAVQEPVIVNEQVTTTVGPASVIDVKSECYQTAYAAERLGDVRIIEEERLRYGAGNVYGQQQQQYCSQSQVGAATNVGAYAAGSTHTTGSTYGTGSAYGQQQYCSEAQGGVSNNVEITKKTYTREEKTKNYIA